MKIHETWKSFPPRTRVLLGAAALLLPLVATTHAAIRPLLRSIRASEAQIQVNERLLSSIESGSQGVAVPPGLAEKELRPLSAASIVEALTETAHANAIRRITFKTGAVETMKRPPQDPMKEARLQRMPVSVNLETGPGAFVAYLEDLNALSFPLSVERFEMKRNREAGSALLIRLEIEVYGERA
jgi:type II secretory pathway component PulM